MGAKEPPKSVFLFYGENTFSSFEKLNHWKSEFAKKYGDTNIEQIESDDLDIGKFATDISSVPFLAEKRMIIIKNFLKKAKAEEQKRVAEILESTQDFCLVVFYEDSPPDKRTSLYQKISKIGEVTEFPIPSLKEIISAILEKSKHENIKISPKTTEYLADYCSRNLWTIKNEVEKLKTFADGKEITKEMIDNLVIPSINSSIFKLTDAIALKDNKDSVKTLRNLIESDEELTMIFFMIVRHFRLMIQIKELVDKKDPPFAIAKRLSIHPFVAQTISRQCKNFTEDQLKNIYQKLLKIDTDFKTGNIRITRGDQSEYELAIEKFILECCKL